MKATYFNSYHKLQSRREKPSSHVRFLQGFSRVILTLNFLCLAQRLQMLYDLFSCCVTHCHRFSCLKNTHTHQLTVSEGQEPGRGSAESSARSPQMVVGVLAGLCFHPAARPRARLLRSPWGSLAASVPLRSQVSVPAAGSARFSAVRTSSERLLLHQVTKESPLTSGRT